MRERPILFSAPMVRAILEGRKTQTRRVVKFDNLRAGTRKLDANADGYIAMDAEGFPRVQWNSTRWACVDCPYGTPGDRLWVREPWKTGNKLNALDAKGIAAKCLDAGYKQPGAPIFYLADGTTRVWGDNDYDDFGEFGRYRHARFMPRWASRITLEIAEVRVQRLQEIREEDSIAEGVEKRSSATWRNYHEGIALFYAKHSFYSLWESINGAGSWDANPWVWALTFKRLEAANA